MTLMITMMMMMMMTMMMTMINCPPPWSLRGVEVYFGIFELSTNSPRLIPHTSHDRDDDVEDDVDDDYNIGDTDNDDHGDTNQMV